MKEKLKQLFGLFGAFAVVGVTTFGGGYAMLPALQREVVEKRRWATEEEVMDWYAIGQCTPGVIAVNTATFVGQKQAGVWGGIFATLGVVFPSLVIIMIIAAFIQNFAHLPAVQNAFAGIRVCVCVLILNAVVKLWKKSLRHIFAAESALPCISESQGFHNIPYLLVRHYFPPRSDSQPTVRLPRLCGRFDHPQASRPDHNFSAL